MIFIFFSPSLPLDAIWAFDNNQLTVIGKNATAGIFATYPSEHLNVVNGFFDQVRGYGRMKVHLKRNLLGGSGPQL